MNVIQDISTVASAVIKDGNFNNVTNVLAPRAKLRSISSFAGNSIYYFPVLCSSNVAPKSAGMVMETLERAYTHFVRATFALMPAMKVAGNQVNVEAYLKQFHQNIGLDVTYGSLALRECAEKSWTLFPNDILNEATTPTSSTLDEKVREKIKQAVDKSPLIVKENEQYELDANNHFSKKGEKHISYSREFKDASKKLNGAEPSVIMVTASFIIEGQQNTMDVTLPVGVKTNLKVLEADRLCDRVIDSLIGKGFVHDIIRWSTGEMLSLKDILFGVDKIKNNVSHHNDDVDEWFNALLRRKRLTSISLPVLNKKAFLPNTAVILSMGDVKVIEQQYGLNIMDNKNAKKLIEDNFLLSLAVVDDMTETLYIMHDGHMHFEEYAYSTVCRENAANDKEMATLIKAIGSMR